MEENGVNNLKSNEAYCPIVAAKDLPTLFLQGLHTIGSVQELTEAREGLPNSAFSGVETLPPR
jgi:hypothetical protein